MKNRELRDLTRREFLATATGLAGGAVSGIVFASPAPCPPPSVSIAGGTAAVATCGGGTAGLPAFGLTSAAASGTYAWTFGHAFRQGDVQNGQYITVEGARAQADVRNQWPDGSVKYAVLSGIAAFSRNVMQTFALSTTSTAPAGSPVAEPGNLNVIAKLSGMVTGAYALQSCVGIDRSTWVLGKPGRVRQILGPIMSEFHYYLPTTDAHVALWFFVRCYANGATEVETVVENGWLNVAAPGERDYSIALSVGGSSVFSANLSHYSHTRWSRVDWIGTDPQIVPRHDPAYLRATKLVPNFGYTNPSPAAFSGLASALNPEPFALGNWTPQMGNVGYQPAIGVLPQWESLYCTTGDPRAYAATISNNRGSGRWPIHYRDETTGRIPNYLTYPNTTLTSGWGVNTPTPTGGSFGPWNIAHHPSNGYLPYLIEGRWTQLESLQFSAMDSILESNPPTRQAGGVLACWNAPLTTRGAGWAWRTMAQIAGISPRYLAGAAPSSPDSTLTAAWVQSIQDTTHWNNQNWIEGSINEGVYKNTIGWLGQYDQENTTSTDAWWGEPWMVNYQSMALSQAADLAIEGLTNQTELEAVRNFSYLHTLQVLGDNTTWNFRSGGLYARPYLVYGSTPWKAPKFLTIQEGYKIYLAHSNLEVVSANPGDTLFQHDTETPTGTDDTSDTGTGYWAMAISVAAQAVEAGVSGATQAYALIQSAPNYEPQAAGASDRPQFAFVPRT